MLSTPESEINRTMNKTRTYTSVAAPGLALAAIPFLLLVFGMRYISTTLGTAELLIAGVLGVSILGLDKLRSRRTEDREAAPLLLLVVIAITVAVLLYVVCTMLAAG